jgi:hypothetical protein
MSSEHLHYSGWRENGVDLPFQCLAGAALGLVINHIKDFDGAARRTCCKALAAAAHRARQGVIFSSREWMFMLACTIISSWTVSMGIASEGA